MKKFLILLIAAVLIAPLRCHSQSLSQSQQLVQSQTLSLQYGQVQSQALALQYGQVQSRESSQSYFGVACIYDYEYSIVNKETRFDPAVDTTIHYLFASDDSLSYGLSHAGSIEELFASLNTGRDLLVIVPGYNDDIGHYMQREPLSSVLYDVDILVFMWPSYIVDGGPIKTFRSTENIVEKAMPLFNKFLNELSAYVTARDIRTNIIFHSLGNRFAMYLGGDVENNHCTDLAFVNNMILNQACVPLKGYAAWVKPLSKAISGNLYITSNKKDKILKLAQRMSEKQRLLGQGPNRKTPFEEIDKVIYLDFRTMLKRANANQSHNFYVRQPDNTSADILMIYRAIF